MTITYFETTASFRFWGREYEGLVVGKDNKGRFVLEVLEGDDIITYYIDQDALYN